VNLDELMTRAARAPRTALAEAQVRRRLTQIQQEYARRVLNDLDVTDGLDLTDPLHADADERAQNARAASLASLGRFTWREATQEMTWTDEVWSMLGTAPGAEPSTKKLFLRRLHREDRAETCRRINEAWASRSVVTCTFRLVRKDHTVVDVDCHLEVLLDEHGGPSGLIGSLQDVTARERARREVERLRRREDSVLTAMSDWDTDTGLFTSRRFADEIDRAMRFGAGAVLVVRIEQPSLDSAGGELLHAVAACLRGMTDRGDQLGRVGTDEIGILLPGTTWQQARSTAQLFVEAVRAQHFIVGGGHTRAHAWGGLVRYPKSTQASSHDLLIDAEGAWRRARTTGKAVVSLSQPAAPETRRGHWRDRVAAAVRMDRFTLFAQPILELASNRITRHELLLRVLDERDEPRPPSVMLDSAERLDAVYEIDLWVIERAMELACEIDEDLQLQVNISGRSLGDARLIDQVKRMMRRLPVNPEQLMFEITETAVISNVTEARRFADEMHEMGCQLALDDFGSGYGSFRYLKLFPIDLVKIDGAFITNLVTSEQDQVLVDAVVRVCRVHGVQTLAEFVQDEATLEILREMGVELAQGYLIGKPRPAAGLLGGQDTQPLAPALTKGG
jgi:EAL domain-containing protein (putative c-di-GMP-specific phosphodiesterase class I)/GGDEF domain-containing protein